MHWSQPHTALCEFWSIGILCWSKYHRTVDTKKLCIHRLVFLVPFSLASSLGCTIVTKGMRATDESSMEVAEFAHKLRPRQVHLALLLLLPSGTCRVKVTAKATIQKRPSPLKLCPREPKQQSKKTCIAHIEWYHQFHDSRDETMRSFHTCLSLPLASFFRQALQLEK